MNVRVEQCWNGGNKYTYRTTIFGVHRENFPAEEWTKELSSYIKDRLAALYPIKRDNIRFIHR